MSYEKIIKLKKIAAILFALPHFYIIALILLGMSDSHKWEPILFLIIAIQLFALYWAYKMFKRHRYADKVIQILSAVFLLLEIITLAVYYHKHYISNIGGLLPGIGVCLSYIFIFYVSRLKLNPGNE